MRKHLLSDVDRSREATNLLNFNDYRSSDRHGDRKYL